VLLKQEATDLTTRCFKRARDKGASRGAAVRIAAAVLTKAAIDRGSKDNVTVVIVDVSRGDVGVKPKDPPATYHSKPSLCLDPSLPPISPHEENPCDRCV
jgi:protein phosphatase 2C